MGLFDAVEGKALSSMLGSSSSPLASGLLQMINNQPGGLQGLIQSFRDKGMGSLVLSWVGSGQNLPISADQISHVLGSDQVKQLAAQAGISPMRLDQHWPSCCRCSSITQLPAARCRRSRT